jgi:plastocyanin
MNRLVKMMMAILITVGIMACNNAQDGYGTTTQNPPPPPSSNTVTMTGSRFSPSTLTVARGTAVTWQNADSYAHTATSDSSQWDTGNIAGGESASKTFSTAGTFHYHCTYHRAMGMTGTIIVN